MTQYLFFMPGSNRAGTAMMRMNTVKEVTYIMWVMAVLFVGFSSDAVARGSSEKGKRTADFFIAVNGSDQWSGQLNQPNRQGTDGPFATLVRARDAVRALKRRRDKQTILVLIRGGVYSSMRPWSSDRRIRHRPEARSRMLPTMTRHQSLRLPFRSLAGSSRSTRRRCCPRSPVIWCGSPMFPRICTTS